MVKNTPITDICQRIARNLFPWDTKSKFSVFFLAFTSFNQKTDLLQFHLAKTFLFKYVMVRRRTHSEFYLHSGYSQGCQR